ncbi:hypothetical protein DPEC_G00137710 [Dallia pectoralis]|uniref:Uncharacterized protein n=1 Tax=Dallia pectoralis TaxID=75939 RepID=A0ACC2GLN7_DALPE|nr:hypothetical protein DPEC_G00137710 [Dallia pectoralis]
MDMFWKATEFHGLNTEDVSQRALVRQIACPSVLPEGRGGLRHFILLIGAWPSAPRRQLENGPIAGHRPQGHLRDTLTRADCFSEPLRQRLAPHGRSSPAPPLAH